MLADKESTIVQYLVQYKEFTSEVTNNIDPDVFTDSNKILVTALKNHLLEYKTIPTKEVLEINSKEILKSVKSVSQPELEQIIVEAYKPISLPALDWAVQLLEDFTRSQRIYQQIIRSIEIYEQPEKADLISSIPSALQEAINTKFKSDTGTSLWKSSEDLYDEYNNKGVKIPFRNKWLNHITNGGAELETLNVINGGINVGKSLSMVSFGADYIRNGEQVQYISGELPEHKVIRRFDANLLGINLDDLNKMTKGEYVYAKDRLKDEHPEYGGLFVKTYPTSSATTLDFEKLLTELNVNGFTPRIIMLDYLTIFASYKIKRSKGPYEYYKSVAEEVRAFAMDHKLLIWTGSQVGRNAIKEGTTKMEDGAESLGIPMTADFVIGISRRPELDEAGLLLVSHEKTRYGELSMDNQYSHFAIDRQQQRYHEPGTKISVPSKPNDSKMNKVDMALMTKPNFTDYRKPKLNTSNFNMGA